MYDLEWDNNKNNTNRIKHKIDFTDAIQVFFDDNRITKTDDRHDYDEDIKLLDNQMSEFFLLFTLKGMETQSE